jgi:predicted CXXCH cytochrome family protein
LLLDTYADSWAFVQYHHADENSQPWSDARWDYYELEYTPGTVFDGTDKVVGAISNLTQQYEFYRTKHLLPERAIPTDVTLSISATYAGAQTYHVCVQVGMEASGSAKNLRLYVVQVLDHWPASEPYYRNGFKQAAPTVDVSLQPGQSETIAQDIALDAESWSALHDAKIIAWVQSVTTAQVYQAVVRPWPIDAPPGDWDGDGYPDASDNCPRRYNPDQADGDGDGVGDACDNCPTQPNADQANADEDRVGDACDNCPQLHSLAQEDNDGDAVGNPCDSCPDVPAPGGVDEFGRSHGCMDLDCDVDMLDVVEFMDWLGGPDQGPPAGVNAEPFFRADTQSDEDVDLADFAVVQLNYTGALVSPARYVGMANCVSCHSAPATSWQTTQHARAIQTLQASGDENNTLCLPCHTVGFGEAGGFVDMTATPQLANVQCESCHGPGSNHVADPLGFPLPKHFESSFCGACHQSCHGLCGDNHHPQYEQWQTSRHANSILDVWFAPNGTDACMQCHSVDYRLAPAGQKPDMWSVVAGVDCVACHAPHGSANVGQLRLPPRQLCADCHTMGATVPPTSPLQPQAEILHSLGGYRLDGQPLTAPYTMHWWGIPDECVQCHVHKEPYGGPDRPVDSGHRFRENMRACLPCHSEADATALVAGTHDEFELRLEVIAPYFDPASPEYINPATLPPTQLSRYQRARFNFELVQADRSYGSHNPPYLRALLDQTESYLGIPPWKKRPPEPGHWEPPP